MKPAASIALLLFASALAPVPGARAAAPSPAAPAVAPAADVRLVKLRNGMQLLLAPDPTAPAVDVAVWFQAGTVHERAGLSGISHFFEHLMSGGSEHYGPQEHNRLVQAEGGSAGAYTAPDYACFYQTVPPAALDLVLKLEADRMVSLRLTAAGIEAEKLRVGEEKRVRAGSQPFGGALQGLYRLAWTVHPYRWPVIGLDEDLARISLADCQAFYSERYAPNDATVTIVGRFDPEQALQAAKRWLEPLKRRRAAKDVTTAEPAQKAERRAFERMDVPLPMLLVGWKTPGHPDPDSPALSLLARILTGGPAARLQRALAAEPLRSLSVQGALDGRRDAGLLYAIVVPRPGADSASVERALVEEVEKLAREPVSEEELDRVRHQEELGTLFAWQTARGRAEALGSAQLVEGDWHAAAVRLARLQQLTPADLQRAAARVLGAAGRNVLWIAPRQAPAGTPAGTGGGTGGGYQPAEGGR